MPIKSLLRLLFSGSFLVATIASAATGSIEGIVKGVDGKLLSGAEVRIERQDSKQAPVALKTDAKGRFTYNKLTLGTYTVGVYADKGVKSVLKDLRLRTSNPLRLDFDLKPTAEAKKVKKYVWEPPKTGTHLGGGWVEVDAANEPGAQRVERKSGEALRRLQSREFNPRDGQ